MRQEISSAFKNRYTKIKQLGSGSFGHVWLVRSNYSFRNYVMKEMSKPCRDEKEREVAMNEANILAKLKHKNIVRYKEAFFIDDRFCIVMEYADDGDLSTKIKKQNGRKFSSSHVLDWFVQLFMAVKYIHDKKILHRDLKSQNVFLTTSGVLKVGDFGISRVLSCTSDHAQTAVGTPYYLSPEICQRKPYNQKSDIWSLGVILYEMAMLSYPFVGKNLSELVGKILSGKYAPVDRSVDPLIRDLVVILLQTNPHDRPTAADILAIPTIVTIANNFITKMKRTEYFERKDSFKSPLIERKREENFKYDVVFDLTVNETANLHYFEKNSILEAKDLDNDVCEPKFLDKKISKMLRERKIDKENFVTIHNDISVSRPKNISTKPVDECSQVEDTRKEYLIKEIQSIKVMGPLDIASNDAFPRDIVIGKKRVSSGASLEDVKKPRVLHPSDTGCFSVEDIGPANYFELEQSLSHDDSLTESATHDAIKSKTKLIESNGIGDISKHSILSNARIKGKTFNLKRTSPALKENVLSRVRKYSTDEDNCKTKTRKYEVKSMTSSSIKDEIPPQNEEVNCKRQNRQILEFIDDEDFYKMLDERNSLRYSEPRCATIGNDYLIDSPASTKKALHSEVSERAKQLRKGLEENVGAKKLDDLCRFLRKKKLALLDDEVLEYVRKVLGRQTDQYLVMIFELLMLERRLNEVILLS